MSSVMVRDDHQPASSQGPLAEGAEHARHGEQPAVGRLGAADQADDRGELADLQAAEQRGAVADARIASEPADIAAAKGARDPAQRLRIEQGVAVDADQQLVACQHCAGVHGRRLALVLGEVDDAQARDAADQAVEHLGGVVAAAVVHGDDLELRVVDTGGGAQGLLGVGALVVAGHDDRDWRPVVEVRRLGLRRSVELAIKVEDQAARHPVPGHDERIAEAELRDGQQDVLEDGLRRRHGHGR